MNLRRFSLVACVLVALAHAFLRHDIGQSGTIYDTPGGRWFMFAGVLIVSIMMWRGGGSKSAGPA